MKPKTTPLSFFNATTALPAVVGVVEKVGKAVEQSVRVARLQSRVKWSGYNLIDCGNGKYAFTRIDNEGDRHPDRGGYSIEDAERFVRARENEPVF